MQVQRRLAAAIAMSLPGQSALLPYLASIMACYGDGSSGPPTTHKEVAGLQSGAVRFINPMLPYLHSYPQWLASLRAAALPHNHAAAHAAGLVQHTECTVDTHCTEALLHQGADAAELGSADPASGQAPPTAASPAASFEHMEEARAAQQFTAAAGPHVLSQQHVHRAAMYQLSDGSRAFELTDSQFVAAACSSATQQMAGAVKEIAEAKGNEVLANTAVAKALAGAHGRLEHEETEAFLQMRTVRVSNISATSPHGRLVVGCKCLAVTLQISLHPSHS